MYLSLEHVFAFLIALTIPFWVYDFIRSYQHRLNKTISERPVWLSGILVSSKEWVYIFIALFFIALPGRTSSESMLPNYQLGKHYLLNRAAYGVRNPFNYQYLVRWADPQRGEVIAFNLPHTPAIAFMKRVVGIPGDRVRYENHRLSINGVLIDQTGPLSSLDVPSLPYAEYQVFSENLLGVTHKIILDKNRSVPPQMKWSFPLSSFCQYTTSSIDCVVPDNNYFVLGDNRDDSEDSRYWGFVPSNLIMGKVVFTL